MEPLGSASFQLCCGGGGKLEGLPLNPSQQARPATAAGIEAETVWSDGAHGQAYRAISQLRKTLPVSALKIPPCPNATIRRSWSHVHRHALSSGLMVSERLQLGQAGADAVESLPV